MPSIVEEKRLICADVGLNANKFITIVLYDNDDVEVEYGRIGITSTKEIVKEKGRRAFEKKVEAKKKGKSGPGGTRVSVYTEVKTLPKSGSVTVESPSGDLHSIARKQITTNDPLVEKLIGELVKKNVHRITSSTNVTYNAATGTFQTPLGIVTPEGISEARQQLATINRFVVANQFSDTQLIQATNLYLRIVPQNVGMKLNIQSLFPDNAAIQRQSDLLDGMEAASATTNSSVVRTDEKVFSVKLHILSGADIDRVRKKYRLSRKDMHVCAHLDVKTVYAVAIETMAVPFDQGRKVGNIMELWHGTKSANVLSILKSGLKTSPPSTAQIAGKLFGNGIYFSDQSTKSLNYAYGYWSGERDNNCFMFLADVAMGKSFTPTGHGNRYGGGNSYPVTGYDSTFAKGGESGVQNNEMVIYRNGQCNLTYLVEFSPGGK